MKIIAYDPFIQEDYCHSNDIGICSLEKLLAEADIISLHLPLNEQTHHMVNRDTIALMRDGAILVNASRGAIIDETAAYEALQTGKLAGLGLDAFEKEPPVGSPLLALDNVVATPHTGAHTAEATCSMATCSVENLLCILENRPCQYRIC